jgi:hypothetical protein
MRIFQYYLPVALFGLGFGLTTAYFLDGAKSPADIAPAVGGAAPQGALVTESERLPVTPPAIAGIANGACPTAA